MEFPRHTGMDRSERLVDTGNCEHCPFIKSSLLFIEIEQGRFRQRLERTLADAEEIAQLREQGEAMPAMNLERIVEVASENHDRAVANDVRYIEERVKNCRGPSCEVKRRGLLGRRLIWHCQSPIAPQSQ